MKRQEISRRVFMIGAAAAAAGCATGKKGARASGAGASRRIPTNERLNIAGIGIGGKGFGDMERCARHNVVALCDVD